MFVDTHCHISVKDFPDLEKVIEQMQGNIMIVCGTNDESNYEVIELCKKYNNVYGALGIHPEEIDNMTEDSYKIIEENINNPKILGVGEIGLDYHWRQDNKLEQQKIFIEQIRIAKKYNKAIVIHSRDAINDTYNILKREYYQGMRAIIHCFSSSLEMAQKFIELGAMIGIGGVLTFKNANKMKEIIKNIDLSHILLETDSPYLSPEPFRGQLNVPYNVTYVAQKIAEIKDISLEEVFEQTTKNAFCQFDFKANL